MNIEEVLKHDSEFKYQLLSRLQSDCEFFLGYGDRRPKVLWAQDVSEQIKYMKAIHENLKDKPEWLTMDHIKQLEKLMNHTDES